MYSTPDNAYTQPANKATILVVEDNEVLRRGLRLLLETDGFRVIVAQDGQEALEYMASVTPDLILSDIAMPRMDGIQFFGIVRQRPEWVTIPFIFLTAHSDRNDIIAGKLLGAEDYLVKPVNHVELLSTIRSRLARSQQLLLAQLQQAYELSLIMLSNAIELRDHYTRGHVERVMRYSLVLANEMNYGGVQMMALQFGAILHDVGKIHIPEHILRKPGPLDEQEWVIMRKHPVIGADLVHDIPYLNAAIPVILHHHERWDGSGYPSGLSGENIPLGARIVAVADSLDAMTSSRTYQARYTPEQAFQQILLGRGQQYDPLVVGAFERSWGRIRETIGTPLSVAS